MIKCWATENSVYKLILEGFVRSCCKFEGNFGKFENYDSIDAILNGKDYNLLPNGILLGNMTKACWRCKEAEDRGYRSRRLHTKLDIAKMIFAIRHKSRLYCKSKM